MMAALAAAASTNVVGMEEQRGAIPGGVSVPDAPKAQEPDQATPSKSEGGTGDSHSRSRQDWNIAEDGFRS